MPKKITFVLENFYPDYRAGTETYVLNLAKGILLNNWQVSVIIAAVGKSSFQYNYNGIDVFALSVPLKISTKELNGQSEPSNLQEFKKIISVIKPDIIHFHSFSRSFTHLHLKEAYKIGAKVFFTAHIAGIFCARGDLQLFNRKQCNAKIKKIRCSACFASQKFGLVKSYFGAALTYIPIIRKKYPALNLIFNKKQSMYYLQNFVHTNIAIAKWIKKAFEINGIFNTQYISQSIDTSIFTKKRKKEIDLPIIIGFIGRMNPSKGLHLLMNILKKKEFRNSFILEIITIKDYSQEAYYQKIKQNFEQLGFTQWYENISHNEINNIMDNWDLLILPSFYEVAPFVILEANAKKIPVLGSDFPAISEMIEDNYTGLIFKNMNGESLAEKLQQIARKPQILNDLSKNIKKVKTLEQLVKEHILLYS